MMKKVLGENSVYRGPRPKNQEELEHLFKSGVRTIISLEEGWGKLFGWKGEESLWKMMGGRFIHLRMSNVFPPTLDQCQLVEDTIHRFYARGSVFIHCYAGVDRTGFVSAYLAYINGYSAEQAWQYAALDQGMHKRYYWWKKYFMKMVGEVQQGSGSGAQ